MFDDLFRELKRRRVFRVAAAYAVTAWIVVEVASVVLPALDQEGAVTVVVVLALLGFPVAVALAWAFDVTPDGVQRTAENDADPDAVADHPAPGGATAEPAPIWRRRGFAAVVGVLLLLTAGVLWFRPQDASSTVRPGADVIAVLPFSSSGEGVDQLGEGMVDLLSRNLDWIGPIRTIEPRTVLQAWQRHGGADAMDAAGLAAVGRDVGAGAVLSGSLVGAGGQVRIDAELRAVDGTWRADAAVRGPADSIFSLVDSVSIELVRGVWRARTALPEVKLQAITTGSLDALREFLRGERWFREARWDSAQVAFERAVEQDSTFALALMRLAQTAGWQGGIGAGAAYAQAAARYVDRLPERERQILEIGNIYIGRDIAAYDRAREFVQRYPDDPEGWVMLAEVIFHADELLALSPDSLYEAYDRVLALDSTLGPALIHPIEVAARTADSARLARYVDRMATRLPPERVAPYRAVQRSLTAPVDTVQQIIFELAREGFGPNSTAPNGLSMAVIAGSFLSPDRAPASIHGLTDRLAEETDIPQQTLSNLRVTEVATSVAAGRLRDAAAAVDRAVHVSPPTLAYLHALPLLAGYISPDSADAVLAVVDSTRGDTDSWQVEVGLAMIALIRGDPVTARRHIEIARTIDTAAGGFEAEVFQAIDGWAAIVEGDTVGGLQTLEAGLRDGRFDWGISTAPVRLAWAATLAARPETRDEGIRRLRYGFTEDYPYLPMAYIALGEAYEAKGDRTAAARAYAQVLRMWSDADPEMQPRIAAVQRALERVSGEPEAG